MDPENQLRDSTSLSLGEHLEEIRRLLFKSILYVAIGFILIFVFKDFVFSKIIFAPKEPWFFTNAFLFKVSNWLGIKEISINSNSLKIINVTMAGQFSAHLLVSFVGAIIIAFPMILMQLWKYVSPALYPHEKRKIRHFVLVCSVLFFTGVLFAYYIIVPLSINFLGNYKVTSDVDNTVTLMSFVSTVTILTLSMGLVFQFPVLIMVMKKMDIISASFLRRNRKIAFVILMIASAIITPPDFFSLLLVVIPMYLLFEISIKIISK